MTFSPGLRPAAAADRVHVFMGRHALLLVLTVMGLVGAPAGAIVITVDYRYDTNGFFDLGTSEGVMARAALEAAAGRFSAIITTPLSAVSLTDNSRDDRIGFTHPGTGLPYDVSAAASSATDALAVNAVAEEYRGAWSIAQDEWILYAGGRSLGSGGIGGTGTGLNFSTVFTDGASVLNRDFRASGSVSNLPVWGGAISFDDDGSTPWHYDHTTAAASGTTDLYSIALHEIGHALGLSTSWNEWGDLSLAGVFSGSNAVAAYNADNGASETTLNLVSALNPHWADGAYDSNIFALGNPNVVGTVGLGVLQDLLMEPTANFVFPTIRRFELTNADVAALEDLGWTVVVPEPASLALLIGGGLVVLRRPTSRKNI